MEPVPLPVNAQTEEAPKAVYVQMGRKLRAAVRYRGRSVIPGPLPVAYAGRADRQQAGNAQTGSQRPGASVIQAEQLEANAETVEVPPHKQDFMVALTGILNREF